MSEGINPNRESQQEYLGQTATQAQMEDYNDQWKKLENQNGQLNTGQFSYSNYYWPYHHNCRPRRYCPYCGQLLNGWDYNMPYWYGNSGYLSSSLGGGHQH